MAGELTFNQSIGLIHYCRVGFKLSQQLPPQLAATVKSVVIRILEELKLRVEMNQVLYSEQENRDKKNHKLQLVVCEYLGKYSREMQGEVGPVVLPHLEQQLSRHLQDCEIGIGAEGGKGRGEGGDLPKAYLSMVFLSLSLRLGEAVACKSWGFFGSGGMIECCL